MGIRELRDSHDTLDSIEEHFKIEAGPGAGKTTFLANHIKRVLLESKRLKSTRKVACITYTNVGVNSLKKRLGSARQSVEISTIHSFLYKHILKPYFWMLDDWPFENMTIPTLYRQRLSGKLLRDVIIETKGIKILKNNFQDAREALESTKWVKEKYKYAFKIHPYTKGKIRINDKDQQKEYYNLSNEAPKLYRQKCHQEGILLYEDVLYYSYSLLKKHEEIREIVRAKFPYIFIDEFQDTTPLQTDILKLLSEKEVVMGVIGDQDQSIYGFTGSTVKDFINWKLPGIRLYTITQNRRAHQSIIDVLNYFKGNKRVKQTAIRCRIDRSRPLVIPGTLEEATIFCRAIWGSELSVLGYNFDKTAESYNPALKGSSFKEFLRFLSDDGERGRKIRSTLIAIEAFENLDYKKALNEIESLQKRDAQVNTRDALKYLELVRKTYHEYWDRPLSDYYMNELYKKGFTDASRIADKGRPRENYSISLKDALSAITTEDRKYQEVQTIHSMKGDEADNILVALPSKAIDFLLQPNLIKDKEDHRVYYVAASRARENLAFQVDKDCLDNINGIDQKLFRIVSRDEIRKYIK